MSENKRRKAWLAGVLSALVPGVGQLYNQEIRKFVFVLIVFNFFGTLALALILSTPWALIAYPVIVFFAWIGVILDAGFSAKRINNVNLAWFNRWYIYVGVWIISQLLSGTTASFVKDVAFETFKFPSSSMQPTIREGDYILVQKHREDPSRFTHGDIVLFTLPDDPVTPEIDESQTHIIKRLIGLPGDTVEVKGRQVILNGKPIDEPYASWELGGRKDFEPVVVPENSVFVLGDNRDKSKDSRYIVGTFIPFSRVEGRALYVYWNSKLHFERMGVILDQP
jgi:signal peptidase I